MNVIKVEPESDSKVLEFGVKKEHAEEYSSVTFVGKTDLSFRYLSNHYFCVLLCTIVSILFWLLFLIVEH
jgi:hypothetical protein